eukprot:Rhum_TRINITY_DN12552_c0_g3::Rhum_TRINITY_DN12552_c0_g3_i1::g.52730::m.52730
MANDTAAQRVELEQSFADGVSNVLSPLIAQHTEAVFAVQQSQAALSTSVDALKAKLEDSLPYSQLPQVGAYLQKLSEMKRRIATLSATLNRTNDRLVRTERFAQAQYGTLKACNDQRQSAVSDWLSTTEASVPAAASSAPTPATQDGHPDPAGGSEKDAASEEVASRE